MSSTSARTSASTAFTGSDFARSRLSGRTMMSRNAMRGDLSGALWPVNQHPTANGRLRCAGRSSDPGLTSGPSDDGGAGGGDASRSDDHGASRNGDHGDGDASDDDANGDAGHPA